MAMKMREKAEQLPQTGNEVQPSTPPTSTRRSDPFGQRFLRDEATVFDHNAWDNVEWPEEKEEEIGRILNSQNGCPVPPEDAFELLDTPATQWEAFYQTHNNKFFMDRKWIAREFPELFQKSTQQIRLLEVGCGAGNTTIPLLEANDQLFIYSCDFSQTAIETLRRDERVIASSARCRPFLWDITDPEGTEQIQPNSLDFVLCIFVLSAIPPNRVRTAVHNLVRLLKPGGLLLVKDYGRHDLTQLRFKSGRLIDNNFYRRGDNTLVYFFTPEELDQLFREEMMLQKVQNFVDKRLIVNRAKRVKMYRRWIQCKYRKQMLQN